MKAFLIGFIFGALFQFFTGFYSHFLNQLALSDFLTLTEIAVLALTAWIVYEYTIETKKLRHATELQTNYATEPYITLDTKDGMIVLCNKGSGFARDVRIISSETPEKFDFVYIEAIAAGEKEKIRFRTVTGPEYMTPGELKNWLIIDYCNSAGKQQQARFRRADYGDGFTKEDRDAGGPIPEWVLQKNS